MPILLTTADSGTIGDGTDKISLSSKYDTVLKTIDSLTVDNQSKIPLTVTLKDENEKELTAYTWQVGENSKLDLTSLNLVQGTWPRNRIAPVVVIV